MDSGTDWGTSTLRIAQVAPLYESVPPPLYGGTERIVSYLTEELVRQGHEVTLFASGDSKTSARLIAPCEHALRLGRSTEPIANHYVMFEQLQRAVRDFDLVHYHVDYLHFPVTRRMGVPHVTTLHGRLDAPDLVPLYGEYDDMPLISISDSQRSPLSWARWRGTVLHGLPPDLYRFEPSPRGYLAFLGRIDPTKGLDRAIEIAARVGMPLRVAAKLDAESRPYYESVIAPLLAHAQVELIGEIGDREKQSFLGHADALLFPVDWPEPFGLVMIEAMACGTPVIAFRRGSVPEVIEDGVTGFLCESVEEAAAAVARLDDLPRKRCRAVLEERFTAERMAHDYVDIYQRELARSHDDRRERDASGLRDRRHHAAGR